MEAKLRSLAALSFVTYSKASSALQDTHTSKLILENVGPLDKSEAWVPWESVPICQVFPGAFSDCFFWNIHCNACYGVSFSYLQLNCPLLLLRAIASLLYMELQALHWIRMTKLAGILCLGYAEMTWWYTSCLKSPQLHCVLEESSKWPRKVKFTGKTSRNHVGVIELERPLKKLKETRGKEGNGRGEIYFRA